MMTFADPIQIPPPSRHTHLEISTAKGQRSDRESLSRCHRPELQKTYLDRHGDLLDLRRRHLEERLHEGSASAVVRHAESEPFPNAKRFGWTQAAIF